jgi:hypothetical protein
LIHPLFAVKAPRKYLSMAVVALERPSTTTKTTKKKPTIATERNVASEAAQAAPEDEAGTEEALEDSDPRHLRLVHLGPDTAILDQEISLKAVHLSEVAHSDVDGVPAVEAGLITTTMAVTDIVHHHHPVVASI